MNGKIFMFILILLQNCALRTFRRYDWPWTSSVIWRSNVHSSESITAVSRNLIRDHSGYGLSQWETMLQCNIVSHWLSPYPEWSLLITVNAYVTTQGLIVRLPYLQCANNGDTTGLHWAHNKIYTFCKLYLVVEWGGPSRTLTHWLWEIWMKFTVKSLI